MGGRYDEICHDNETPLPPNSTAGKEDEPVIVEEEDEEEAAKKLEAQGRKPWLHEDNPALWQGQSDEDDYDDYSG